MNNPKNTAPTIAIITIKTVDNDFSPPIQKEKEKEVKILPRLSKTFIEGCPVLHIFRPNHEQGMEVKMSLVSVKFG